MSRFLKQVEQRIYAKVLWRLEAAKPLLKYLRTHLEALLPPTSQRNWQLDVHDVHDVHGNGAAMMIFVVAQFPTNMDCSDRKFACKGRCGAGQRCGGNTFSVRKTPTPTTSTVLQMSIVFTHLPCTQSYHIYVQYLQKLVEMHPASIQKSYKWNLEKVCKSPKGRGQLGFRTGCSVTIDS